jgi:cell surface protein SprA
MKFDLGPAEKIFGPGGVQVRTSGSAAVKFGYNRNKVDNPSLSVQNRTTGGFDFDEQINLNINARVGDKVNMNLNYNTEATFDVDAKMIKMRYEGKEDEIIRLLEAGNISFPTNSSLIQGATSLFGIRSDLQFGKLKLQMVLSQKESTSTSVNSQGGQQITDFEIDASSYDDIVRSIQSILFNISNQSVHLVEDYVVVSPARSTCAIIHIRIRRVCPCCTAQSIVAHTLEKNPSFEIGKPASQRSA